MSISAAQFDPTLAQLGRFLGLLDANGGFNVDWLQDPFKNLSQNYTNDTVNQLAALLEGVLGGASGSSLGTPIEAGQRTWFPIQMPSGSNGGGAKPLGVYFVTEHVDTSGAPTTNPDNPSVFGLGVMPQYVEAGLRIAPYAYLPILKTPASLDNTVAFETLPLELGFNISRSDGTAFGQAPVTFSGLLASFLLYFNGSKPQAQVVLSQLTLPGRTQPADYNLLQIEDDIDQWIRVAVGILASQLMAVANSSSEAKTFAAVTEQLLGLLGLTGEVPSPDWTTLSSGSFSDLLLQWLAQIAGSAQTMQQWLYELYYLFAGTVPDGSKTVAQIVSGSGTIAEPWFVPVLSVTGVGSVNFTVAVEQVTVNGTRTLTLYPGLAISSPVVTPLGSFPSAGVQFSGSVTIARMTLSGEADGATLVQRLFPDFTISAIARNTVAGQPLISAPDPTVPQTPLFQVGAIELGLAYDATASKITPVVELTNVVTESASWDAINLTNGPDLIDAGKKLLSDTLTTAVRDFLNVTQGSTHDRAESVTALLGVLPPAAVATTWPVGADDLLLGANRLQLLITDPLQALAAYHTRCLTAPLGSAPAWKALLPDMGALLTGTLADITAVGGSGTQADPWKLRIVTEDGGLAVAYLTAYQTTSGSAPPELTLSLDAELTLAVFDFRVSFDVIVDVVRVALPASDGSGQVSATPMLGARCQVVIVPPQSPEAFGGLSITADGAIAAAGWSRALGFFAGAEIQDLKLIAQVADRNPITTPIGSLSFNSSGSSTLPDWNAISQTVIHVLGTWLFSGGGPAGVTIATALGALPDVSAIYSGGGDSTLPYPEALTLPGDWPGLTVADPATFFANPWPDLKKQIVALFSAADTAIPLIRLVDWCFTQTLPDPPSPAPVGTIDDPWFVTLTNVGGIAPLVWAEPANTPQRIGFGLQRTASATTSSGVEIDATIRLDAGYLDVGGGTPAAMLPRLVVTATLSNPGAGHLVNVATTGTQIATATLGATFTPSSGGITVAPVLTLTGCALDSATPLGSVTFTAGGGTTVQISVERQPAWSAAQSLQAAENLLNTMMTAVSQAAATRVPSLDAALSALTTLGLFQKTGASAYGVNPLAWQSLLANPDTFLKKQFAGALADPAAGEALLADIATLLGLDQLHISFFEKNPNLVQAVLTVLDALALVVPVGQTYTVACANMLSFVEDPLPYLKTNGGALLSTPDLQKQLVTAFGAIAPLSTSALPLTFSFDAGSTIRIGTSTDPAQALLLGGVLQLVIDLVLDLHGGRLQAGAGLGAPSIGTAVMFDATVTASAGDVAAAFACALEAIPTGTPPSFDEGLVLFSSTGGLDTTTLIERLPLTVLSIAAANVLNSYVLPNYAVARRLLAAVNIAVDTGLAYQVQGILPVLLDPVGWLASPSVIGAPGGGIDFDRVGTLLYDVVGTDTYTGPGGATLSGIAAASGQAPGLQIGGLPYGLAFQLTAQQSIGVEGGISAAPAFANLQFKKAAAAVAFLPASGVHVNASLDAAVTLNNGNVFEAAATLETNTVTLDLTATPSSGSSISIKLIPFEGFTQLISGGTTVLLEYVGQKLQALYNQSASAELTTIVDDVIALAKDTGITDFTSLSTAVSAIAANPPQWLGAHFGGPAATDFARLLTDLKITGVTPLGSTVVFALNKDVTISLGTKTQNGSTLIGVWIDPAVTTGFVTMSAATGVTVDVSRGNALDFVVNGAVELVLGTNSPFTAGPALQLAVDVKAAQPITLSLYPVGTAKPANADLFALALVPAVSFEINNAPLDAETWTTKCVLQVLTPFAVDALLVLQPVLAFLNGPLVTGKSVTPGSILSGAKLVTSTGSGTNLTYSVRDVYTVYGSLVSDPLSFFSTLGLGLLQGFVGPVADQPATFEFPFSVGEATASVGIVGAPDPDGVNVDYGLQVQLNDLTLTSGRARENTPASTGIVLQIGQSTSADVKNGRSWLNDADPDIPKTIPGGLTVYFVRAPKGGTSHPSFFIQAQLVNFGLDIAGAPSHPLIDVGGVTLNEIELRSYFSIALVPDGGGRLTVSDLSFGAGAELQGVGIPLGPGFQDNLGQQNPVAASVLSSASSSGGSSSAPINPAFSAGFEWVRTKGQNYFGLELYDATEASTQELVLPIQRAFGPIQCRQLGVGWESSDSDLSFLFDGSVALFGLDVDLRQFQVGVALTKQASSFFDKLQFSLKGLEVTFEGGPVTIEGGLLETTLKDGTIEYDGNILVQASKWGLAAIGSFAAIAVNGDTHPSLMVFLALDAPLGGPPYFYVTGLAGGFGYNRAFNPPAQDAIATFPFVAGVTNPSIFGSKDSQGNYQTGNVLAVLNPPAPALPAAPPQLGTYFLAGGVMFTSFEIVNAYALLVVEFGNAFEVSLLGLATISLPKPGSEDGAFAYAELQILIVVQPSQGILQASAYLSPNSFVIDKACQLTGGFAFYLWFDGSQHPGEFVVTLGGYHPSFHPPFYYPVEPRLAFNWPISGDLHIGGDAYFALTPTAVMAGGGLDAAYSTGPLSAWFDARADMLITWKPFTYDIYIGVDAGVSFKTPLGTLSTSLGASVHIWGPDFRLVATVSWYVISFTVSIGDTDQGPSRPVVDWDQFKSYFLPTTTGGDVLAAVRTTATDDPNAPYAKTLVPILEAGVIRNVNLETGQTPSVSPNALSIAVQTHVPITALTINGASVALPNGLNTDVGVGPMNSGKITAAFDVTLLTPSGAAVTNVNTGAIAAPLGAAAAALWNTTNDVSIDATPLQHTLLSLNGITLSLVNAIVVTPAIDILTYLTFEVLTPHIDLPFSGLSLSPVPAVAGNDTPIDVIMNTVTNTTVVQYRGAVIGFVNATTWLVRDKSALHSDPLSATIVLDPDGPQDNLAAYAGGTYRAQPLLGAVSGVPSATAAAASAPTPQVWSRASRPPVSAPATPDAGRCRLTHVIGTSQNDFGQTAAKVYAASGTRLDAATLATFGAAAGAGLRLTVRTGHTLVVRVPSQHSITLSGPIAARVVSFDAHDCLIDDAIVAAGGVVSLPVASHIAVTGLDPRVSDLPILGGWSADTPLLQVNPGSLLGDEVVVRPANRHHTRRGRRETVCVRTGSAVVEENVGWITTAFGRHDGYVLVDVARGAGIEVAAGWLTDRGTSEFESLAPADVRLEGLYAASLFSVPAAPAPGSRLLIAARGRDGARLHAVHALGSRDGADPSARRAWRLASRLRARRDNQHAASAAILAPGNLP